MIFDDDKGAAGGGVFMPQVLDGLPPVMLNLEELAGLYRGGGQQQQGPGLGGASPYGGGVGAGVSSVGGGARMTSAAARLFGEDLAAELASGLRPHELRSRGLQAGERMRETDVEGFLRHHHDLVVITAVEEAKEAAERSAARQERVRERDQWAVERRALLESLSVSFTPQNRHPGPASLLAQAQGRAQAPGPGHSPGSALQGMPGGPGGFLALPATQQAGPNVAALAFGGHGEVAAAGQSTMTGTMRAYALVVKVRLRGSIRRAYRASSSSSYFSSATPLSSFFSLPSCFPPSLLPTSVGAFPPQITR